MNTSTSTSKNEVDESTLRSSPRSKKKIKTNPKSERPIWSSKISEISVPISSFRRYNITHRLKKYSPLQLLQLFITKEFVNRWVIFTNNHCLHKFRKPLDVTVNELYAFIGVLIYMGIDYLPETHLYWDSKFHHPFVTTRFSRDRFVLILSCFCISSVTNSKIFNDPPKHCEEFVDHLNDVFPRHYSPSQHLTFDESMVAHKGQSPYRQYIPSKPHKWGYKIWCLAADKYLLKLKFYEGASECDSENGMTHDLILNFLDTYKFLNHILYIDNFFTSPTLLKSLAKLGIAACGSVQMNRKCMPSSSQITETMLKTMDRGNSYHFQHDNICLNVWKDANILKVLYNHIQPYTKPSTLKRWGENGGKFDLSCPQAIKDYFYNARSVDIIGQLHYSYPIGRKHTNQTSSFIYWLIDVCIVNSFTLFKIHNSTVSHLRFRFQLMDQLVSLVTPSTSSSIKSKPQKSGIKKASEHYPVSAKKTGQCVQCYSRDENRKRSSYVCVACNVHLCIGECFGLYHK